MASGRSAGAMLLLIVATALPATAADDGVYSGARLLEDFRVCDERPQDYLCGRAANYVKGYAKRLMQGHVGDPQKPGICLKSNIGVAELMEVVRGFVEANPARGDELAAWLVRDAMTAAYPCGR